LLPRAYAASTLPEIVAWAHLGDAYVKGPYLECEASKRRTSSTTRAFHRESGTTSMVIQGRDQELRNLRVKALELA
jgi:hypothetical protein